jgi:hypothetical protein
MKCKKKGGGEWEKRKSKTEKEKEKDLEVLVAGRADRTQEISDLRSP